MSKQPGNAMVVSHVCLCCALVCASNDGVFWSVLSAVWLLFGLMWMSRENA